MTDTALQAPPTSRRRAVRDTNFDKGFNPLSLILFVGILAAGFLYVIYSVYSYIDATGAKITRFCPSSCCSSPCSSHVLSSAVWTMAANRSGLQMATVRNLLIAWVLTLPAAITLSASL